MRILQSLYDGGGGVPPQLAVTRRLVERGHDVTVLAHDSLRSRVEEVGARFTVFRWTLPGHDMRRRETDTIRDWEPADPLEGAERFRDQVLFGPALANAREVLALLGRHPADVIVLDWLLFGTALAAEFAQIPAVTLVHLPYPLRTGDASGDAFFDAGLPTMNQARAELGLPPNVHWDEQILNTDAVLLLTVPELDPAGACDLPANVHFVGPAFPPTPPPWLSPWPGSKSDPLVLMSFSTTFMDQRNLAERALEAVAGLRARVLFTTGPALQIDGLTVPENVRITSYAPHQAVLPHADLVITHAGFGTIQAALSAGVPMVCLPTGRDQPGNAARVAELGVGLALPPTATPTQIRLAIDDALSQPILKAAAQRLATALKGRDGVSGAVAWVESLA